MYTLLMAFNVHFREIASVNDKQSNQGNLSSSKKPPVKNADRKMELAYATVEQNWQLTPLDKS